MSQTIGFCGYAQAGKDTAAKVLIAHGWERLSFADPLRAALLALDPIVACIMADDLILGPNSVINRMRLSTAVESVGWDEAKKLTEIRELLQRFGTDVVRNFFGPDTWVNLARDSMLPGVDYVFTDARFPNEVEMIHRAGGIVVRIEREGVGPVNAHVSDNIADLPVDYTIHNDGSLEELWDQVQELVS